MNLKRILILGFVFLSTTIITAQQDVCVSSSSSDDLLMELNTIDKCLHDKESAEKEMPKPRTKRYLRTRRNNYYHKLRKNLSAINSTKNKAPKKEVKARDVYLGEVTEQPVLLVSGNNANYKGNLKDVLNNYINDNLVYPESLKERGVEGIVWTSFIIDANGGVKNIVALGPINGELLEAEATRIIKGLPKFKPGKIDNELVNVKHLMAINFEIGK